MISWHLAVRFWNDCGVNFVNIIYLIWIIVRFTDSIPVHQTDSDVKYTAPYNVPSTNFQHSFTKVNATHYLREYGYLSEPDGVKGKQIETKDDFVEALRAFQEFAQIPQTGVLDETTIKKMMAPRCGVKDIEDLDEEQSNPLDSQFRFKSRRKRYAIEGSYWGVKDITYKISKYTSELSTEAVDKIIGRAFKILAHAFFPRYGGDVHFDEEEPWRSLEARERTGGGVGGDGIPGFWNDFKKYFRKHVERIPFWNRQGIDLYSVAAHEIGHSLGLKHSQNHQALMAPFYQGYNGDAIHLHTDDIKGLQHLYGKPSDRSKPDGNFVPKPLKPGKPVPKPTNNPVKTARKNVLNICKDPTLDAITVLGNGSTYAFKGDYYWKLNQLSFEKGYPRNITEDWDALPGFLDAAVTDYDGDTYFFKGDYYWLYDPNGQRYKGYPRKVSVGLVDTPNDVDAAMIWNYDDKPYFFKGKKFWQYSRWGMPSSWPRTIEEIFRGHGVKVPDQIDAALKWTNEKTYVFSGNQYYRLTGWRVMKVKSVTFQEDAEWQPDSRVVIFQEFRRGNRTWVLTDYDRHVIFYWRPNGVTVIFGERYVQLKLSEGYKLCSYCGLLESVKGEFMICSRCLAQHRPTPAFYCSKGCEDLHWPKHKAEHRI